MNLTKSRLFRFLVVFIVAVVMLIIAYASGVYHRELVYDSCYYQRLIYSPQINDEINEWVQAKFIAIKVCPGSEGFPFTSGPGDVAYGGNLDLEFLPGRGKAMRVGLYLDPQGLVTAVFIGHSYREGIVFLVSGSFSDLPIGDSITLKNGRLAVFDPSLAYEYSAQ